MAGDDMNGDEATTIMPNSSDSKVKFMCSHGGKILPRPTDNQMKYVGGETRIVAVHRDITYKDIMKKLAVLFEGDIVLKYQLASEDLESLVSVRSDEDLKYMFEEYHRQERGGMSKLRAFLFPANPLVIDGSYTSPVDPHALEQRYIDAINGIVRTNTAAKTVSPKPPPIFTISSACSSPKSITADQHMDMMSQDTMSVHSYQTARGMNRMQKVHSSPNLYNLNNNNNNNSSGGGGPYFMAGGNNQQHQDQQQRQYHHLRQQHHHARSPSLPPAPIQSYNCPSPNQQLPKVVGTERSSSILALQPVVGRVDAATGGRNSFSGYPTSSRYLRGGGQHYDDTAF